MDDVYLKSGFYTCNICKKYFTAHTRIFLGKEKGYGCPYCKNNDFTEFEFNKGRDGKEEANRAGDK